MSSSRTGSYPAWLSPAKALWGLSLLGGCIRPVPQPTTPTQETVPHAELEALWDSSLVILRRHDLHPDRQDRALGLITTLPSTSGGIGEFWRQDVADPYSQVQATIQTIRRQATVRFLRREKADWDIDVQVEVFREARPESQVTNASSAFQAFSGVLPSVEGISQNGGKPESWWVPLGRDGALENRLMNAILARAGVDPLGGQDQSSPP